MRSAIAIVLCLAAGAAGLAGQASRQKTLDIYYIDTEGGQSTLFVAPSGETLLVDTGNSGDRDLGRIVETLKGAGVKQIDHMWTTHYHSDHVGALLALAKEFPMMHFYDHGTPNAGDRIVSAAFLTAYEELSKGKRTIVKPGDKVKMTGLDVTTVASANQFIRTNLPGGGKANPACAGVKPKDESTYIDPDNGDSAGFIMTYGKFRTADLGDLTWNGEIGPDVPDEPDRDGGPVSRVAPRAGSIGITGARECARAARGRDEQRHTEGWGARRVQGALRLARARGRVAAALVVQRRPRQPARHLHCQRG